MRSADTPKTVSANVWSCQMHAHLWEVGEYKSLKPNQQLAGMKDGLVERDRGGLDDCAVGGGEDEPPAECRRQRRESVPCDYAGRQRFGRGRGFRSNVSV